jgi:hypothetical protein
MAYCRWSSDDFRCDVYVYEADKWTIHVAGNRILGDIPRLPKHPQGVPEAIDAWFVAYRQQSDFVKAAQREDIDLPHAGETLEADTPGECAATLKTLRGLGYRVPQYAIDALEAEQAEMDKRPKES